MLLDDTPTTSGLRDQKPEQPRVASVRLVPPGHGSSSSVWHSGNVCQHSLDQICNPETRQTAAKDVERWRSIESICLHLRGIDVTGDVGILKGPVSFEDVFQVLGLDDEGESLAKPLLQMLGWNLLKCLYQWILLSPRLKWTRLRHCHQSREAEAVSGEPESVD